MTTVSEQEYLLKVVTKGLGEAVAEIKTLNKNMEKSAKATGKASESYETLGGTTDKYGRAIKGVGHLTNNATKSFSKMSQGMQSGLVPAYATVAANVFALTAAFGALSRAADLQILIESAEILATQTGRSLVGLANNMKAITDGALSMKDALTSASIAASAGFDNTTIKELTQVARNASVALGRDLTDSMNRVFKGAIKAEPELLDELGIILRLEPATNKYAASLGKAASELTTFEKQQAVVNAVLEQGQDKFATFGDVDTNPYTKLAAAFQDIANSLITLIATPIAGFLEFFTENTTALTAAIIIFANSVLKTAIPALTSLERNITDVIDKGFAKLSISTAVKKMKEELDGTLRRPEFDKGILTSIVEDEVKNLGEIGSEAGKALGAGLTSILDDPSISDKEKFSKIYLNADSAITSLKNNTEALGQVSKEELGAIVTTAEAAKEALRKMGVPVSVFRERIADLGTIIKKNIPFAATLANSFSNFVKLTKAGISSGFAAGLSEGFSGITKAVILANLKFEEYARLGNEVGKTNQFINITLIRLSGVFGTVLKGINTLIPIIGQLTIAWSLLSSGYLFFLNLFRDEEKFDNITKAFEDQEKALKTAEKAIKKYNIELKPLLDTTDNVTKKLELQKNVLLELTNTMEDSIDNVNVEDFGFFGADLDDFTDNIVKMSDALSDLGATDEVNVILREFNNLTNLSAKEAIKAGRDFANLSKEMYNLADATNEANEGLKKAFDELHKGFENIQGSLPTLTGIEQTFVSLSEILSRQVFTDAITFGSNLETLRAYEIELLGIGEAQKSLLAISGALEHVEGVRQSQIEENTKKIAKEAKEISSITNMWKQGAEALKALMDPDITYEHRSIKVIENETTEATKAIDDLGNSIERLRREAKKDIEIITNAIRELVEELNLLINAQLEYSRQVQQLDFEKSLPGVSFAESLKLSSKIMDINIAKLKILKTQADLVNTANKKTIESTEEAINKVQNPITDHLDYAEFAKLEKDAETAQQTKNKALIKELQLKSQLGDLELEINKVRINEFKMLKGYIIELAALVSKGIWIPPGAQEATAKLKELYSQITGYSAEILENNFKSFLYYNEALSRVNATALGLYNQTEEIKRRTEALKEESKVLKTNLTISDDLIESAVNLEIARTEAQSDALKGALYANRIPGDVSSGLAIGADSDERKKLGAILKELAVKEVELEKQKTALVNKQLEQENIKIKLQQDSIRSTLREGLFISKAKEIQIKQEEELLALSKRTKEYNTAGYKEQEKLIKERAKLAYKTDLNADLGAATESAREFSDVMETLADRLENLGSSTDKFRAGLVAIAEISVLSDSETAIGLSQLAILTEEFGSQTEEVRKSFEAMALFAAGAAGALANAFEEGSTAAETFQVIQTGLALVSAVRAVMEQGTGGDPYTAFARMAAMAAAAAALLSQINVSFSGGGGGFTAAEPATFQDQFGAQGAQGIDLQTNSLRDSIDALVDIDTDLFGVNRDLKISIVNLNRTFDALGAAVFNQSGDFSAGNILDQFGIQFGTELKGGSFGGLFGSSTKTNELLAAGIQFGATIGLVGDTLGGSIIDADAYITQQITKTKSSFFGGSKTKVRIETSVSELEPRVGKALQDALDITLDTLLGLFESLGSDIPKLLSGFAGLDIDVTKLDLSGKSAKDQSDTIAAFFSNLTNELIDDLVPGLEAFTKAGEELTDTLIRISTETQELNTSFSTIGLKISDFGLFDNIEEDYNTFITNIPAGVATINQDIQDQIDAIEATKFVPPVLDTTDSGYLIDNKRIFEATLKTKSEFEKNKREAIAALEEDLYSITSAVVPTIEAFKVLTLAAWNEAFLSGFENVDEMSDISERFYTALFSEQELADIAVTNAEDVVGKGIAELAGVLYKQGFGEFANLLSEDMSTEDLRDIFDVLTEIGAFASVEGAALLGIFVRAGVAVGDLEIAIEEAVEEVNNLNQQYERQIALFGLLGKELDLLQLDFDFADALTEAEETGTDIALVETYYGLERLQIIKDYNDQILAEFESVFSAISDSVLSVSRDISTWDELAYQSAKIEKILSKLIPTLKTPINVQSLLQAYDFDAIFEEIFAFEDIITPENISEQITLVEDLRTAVIARYEAEKEAINEIEELIENLEDFIGDISDFIDSLFVQEISPTTSYEKLIESERQFKEDLKNIYSKDKDIAAQARENILSSAETYLGLANEFFSIGDGFKEIFDFVVKSLRSVEHLTEGKLGRVQNKEEDLDDIAKDTLEQLGVLDNILDELVSMNDIAFANEVEEAALYIGDAIGAVETKLQTLNDSTWEPILHILESMGSFEAGAENVEQSQLAFVHKGEAILSQNSANLLRSGELSLISKAPEQRAIQANVDNSNIVEAINILTQVVAAGNEENLEQTEKIAEATSLISEYKPMKRAVSVERLI